MIRLAEQNAAGNASHGSGTRYARSRLPSSLCSAWSDIGANPYMMAVALVTTSTRSFQLLNGPTAKQPTTAATRIENTGTPFAYVFARAHGISRSSPSAYDRRADVPT